MQNRIFSNAIWNVVNGSSSAVVAVAVPPFLTRLLSPEAYGAWALALQIGTYMGLFGFGLQMAVGRYVAYAEARNDIAQRDGIVSTAFWFLGAASVIGWLTICGVGLSIERLLPNLSPDLAGQTRGAIILVGLALAINLPASIFAAVFTGQHRSDVPAKIQGLGRVLLALGLIVAGFSSSLTVLGLVYAVVSILTALALWFAWRTRTRSPSVAMHRISWVYGHELASFCFSLTIWNFATLLVSGLDLLIVGRWDYAATPYFAVSVTLMTLVAGTIASLANALVPAAASLPEDKSGKNLRDLLLRSSRLVMAASIIAGVPMVFGGYPILKLWLGPTYAAHAAPILAILTSATMIRNAHLPYVTLAIGTGYQRKLTIIPLIEGSVSVAASLLLVGPYGAYGVAIAKLIGGVTGVVMLIINHPLKSALGNWARSNYLYDCIFIPALAIAPIFAASFLLEKIMPNLYLIDFVLMYFTALISVWIISLSPSDREFSITFIRKRFFRIKTSNTQKI